MSSLAPSTPSLPSTERIGQGSEFERLRPPTASIHILDDDSLLNVFYLYRPAIFDGDDDDGDRLFGGKRWDREEWWYKLAHVCQRWRNLILRSASYLGLCLVCTFGTPVADMLAHSPPFPLIIDYDGEDYDVLVEDEKGIVLALEQRDRIRRIRLWMPILRLQKLILMAINEEYPILEYMIMGPLANEDSALILPETLQAPHLHHLVLSSFTFPTGSLLLTTAVGLITLCLHIKPPFTDFRPAGLLQSLSSMPHLEMLVIFFSDPNPNRDVERQLMRTPITTQLTLPNLRLFFFRGVNAYLEALVRRITAPSLEMLGIDFFEQLTFSVPHLLQFINTTENLRGSRARFEFLEDSVVAEVFPYGEALSITVLCCHLDRQVSSVAQISDSLSQIFSAVENLTLKHQVHNQSSEEHNEVDRTEWHKFLRSFSNVKTLQIDHGLVGELSRSLRPDDEEPHLELLPELQELRFTGSGHVRDAFTSFIDARQNAGHPVTLGAMRQGMAAILEPSTHTQATEPLIQPPHYYPYPSTPTNFHPHWTHDVLKEDFVMSNTPQIYGILINIFPTFTWSYTSYTPVSRLSSQFLGS